MYKYILSLLIFSYICKNKYIKNWKGEKKYMQIQKKKIMIIYMMSYY